MPRVLRKSGPAYMRDGVMFQPRAAVAACDWCGKEHAPASAIINGKRVYGCQWINNAPGCAKGDGDG